MRSVVGSKSQLRTYETGAPTASGRSTIRGCPNAWVILC